MEFAIQSLGRALGRVILSGSLLFAGLGIATAQDSSSAQQDSSAAPQADNTKVNQRDRDAQEATADKQKQNRADLDIVQQIRKSIMKDKSLSTYAHNVKVISQNGNVTLKGPVRSDDEKKAIEAKAAEVAGGNNVTSELEVKPQN